MKLQYTIIKNGQRLDSLYGTEEEFEAFLIPRKEHKVFGQEAREEQVLVSEAIPAVLDEEGNELSPEVAAVYETIVIPAEYEIEVKDISEEIDQARINNEALAYLASTDYMILRHRDQLELGVTPSLSEQEYLSLLSDRQIARDKVVR